VFAKVSFRFRRWAAVAAVSAVPALAIVSMPATAGAWSQDFCGYLIASNLTGDQGCSSSSHTPDYYSSARYNGGGNIQRLWVGFGDPYGYAPNATFASLCTYGSGSNGSRYSRVGQYDGSASHTIDGHADDSTNHTGCINY
jgi:hypothetical protein